MKATYTSLFPRFSDPRVYGALLALSLLVWLPLLIDSTFVYHIAVTICVCAALSVAWNIVGGYAGQLSLGHTIFYGIGAFTATLLLIKFDVSPWLGLLAGAVLSSVVAIIISFPSFRLRGPFFALSTIAFLEVIRLLAIHFSELTGGAAGLVVPLQLGLKWMLFREKLPYLLISFSMLLLALWVSWALKTSKLGYYLVAIREREDAAKAVGVNTVKVKLIAVAVSAALASVVGSFHAMYLTFIDPESMFSLAFATQIAMFALIGGLGTIAGPVIGTIVVVPLAEFARGWLGAMANGFHGLVYGVILVAVVLTVPGGLVSKIGPWASKLVSRWPGARPARVVLPNTPLTSTSRQHVKAPVLVAKNINKHFGGLHVTHDVSLTLNAGEIIGVIGPNGAGKTTLFNQLSGFLSPDSGSILVYGKDGSVKQASSAHEFAQAGVGRTFQIAQPFTGLSVKENIMLGAFLTEPSHEAAEQLAVDIAELCELVQFLDRPARSLTVGGLKRLEIARALATRPHVLLLDEVMAGLNPTDVERAISVIRKVRDSGVAVLMIEHLMQAIKSLSDRVIVINVGGVIAEGTAAHVLAQREVIEAYLGEELEHAES